MRFCDSLRLSVKNRPLKQGLFIPGLRIPTVSAEMLDKSLPDCVIILAWNFADEILKKTEPYRKKGIRFIVPFPEPGVI